MIKEVFTHFVEKHASSQRRFSKRLRMNFWIIKDLE